jgi:hypothetical protein
VGVLAVSLVFGLWELRVYTACVLRSMLRFFNEVLHFSKKQTIMLSDYAGTFHSKIGG